ncbi:hypothetical protein CEUSTIGMA_g4958.t1 [Chlamydomonas eustigma]|uniref:PLA2c domain-containing protein n=1 Tax=Chlamydomonas eustigma TaxID=1157962 RepID=A0A250X359_9CHLO|nr:hypothetical protein CEUSTIGMA_g4958.t1 [Chlamydomonas eustigma]|eukprot:GAX77514.1 hypothetical protein CEUSTIGMA_g4958.t1 [Chlamydomonas eustigma]
MGVVTSCLETEKSPDIVTCKTWIGDSGKETLIFPELQEDSPHLIPSLLAKPEVGLCLGGGGMRAVTSGLGVLRGLHSLGVLNKLRYLSTTSGSSWLNGPLAFGKYESLDKFLGPYQTPNELTVIKLEDVGNICEGSFAAAITESRAMSSFAADLVKDNIKLSWLQDKSCGWSQAISKAFLVPYGVGDVTNSTVTAIGTQGRVHEAIYSAAEQMGKAVFAYSNLTLPFPIITQSILQASDERLFLPAEWTPLYVGVPTQLLDSTGLKYGGGWIEPIGFNSTVIKSPDSTLPTGAEGKAVTVELKGNSSLGDAVGVSSAYIPLICSLKHDEHILLLHRIPLGKGKVTDALDRVIGGPSSQYWDQQDWKDRSTEWADGGGCDVLGIYPLLRRKVKRIISWVPGMVDPTDQSSFMAGLDSVALAFGAYTGPLVNKIPNALKNSMGQVFLSDGWAVLWSDVSAKLAPGGPVWHRNKYQVQLNTFLGVPGCWEVEVLWIFNCTCKEWESLLPADTKDLLQDDRSSKLLKLEQIAAFESFLPAGLGQFPLIDTMCMVYSPELVTMLSNQSAWVMMKLGDQIKEMMR